MPWCVCLSHPPASMLLLYHMQVVHLLAFVMVFPPSVWCVVLLSLRLLYIVSAVSVNTFLLPLRFFVDSALFLAYNSGVEVRK